MDKYIKILSKRNGREIIKAKKSRLKRQVILSTDLKRKSNLDGDERGTKSKRLNSPPRDGLAFAKIRKKLTVFRPQKGKLTKPDVLCKD
jgi:hypothetical protein